MSKKPKPKPHPDLLAENREPFDKEAVPGCYPRGAKPCRVGFADLIDRCNRGDREVYVANAELSYDTGTVVDIRTADKVVVVEMRGGQRLVLRRGQFYLPSKANRLAVVQ